MCPQWLLTLVWYAVSASARLRLAISSYWALTSAMMLSRSRERLLSMDSTTDVSEIWDCSSDSSCRDQTEHQDLGHDTPMPILGVPTHRRKEKGEEARVGVSHQAGRGYRPASAKQFHPPWLPEEPLSNFSTKHLTGCGEL